jgi:uncharacterized membrane protein YjfL (UPF0719 family)
MIAALSLDGILATVAYAATGGVLLAVGYVVLDLVTPGRFTDLLRDGGSANAAALAMGNLAAVTIVVATAGLSSPDETVDGVISMAGYGAIGVVAQAAWLVALSAGLRGDVGKLLLTRELHPLSVVVATASVALGVVTAVAVA